MGVANTGPMVFWDSLWYYWKKEKENGEKTNRKETTKNNECLWSGANAHDLLSLRVWATAVTGWSRNLENTYPDKFILPANSIPKKINEASVIESGWAFWEWLEFENFMKNSIFKIFNIIGKFEFQNFWKIQISFQPVWKIFEKFILQNIQNVWNMDFQFFRKLEFLKFWKTHFQNFRELEFSKFF